MKKMLLAALLLFTSQGWAVSYNLPAALGQPGAFSSCSPITFSCSGNLSLAIGDSVTLTGSNLTLSVSGALNIDRNVVINQNSAITLGITVAGNIDINESSRVEANLTSTGGRIDVAQNTTITGNLSAADQIDIKKDTLINGNLDATNDIKIDQGSVVTGNLVAGDEIDIQKEVVLNGNLTAGTDIKVDKDVTITGNLGAGDDIVIQKDVTITGNVTATNTLNIDTGTVVNGVCTPANPACNNVPAPGSLVCETFRDEFTTASFNRHDGTALWATTWVEFGDGGFPASGAIRIANGRLQLEGQGAGGGRAVFSGHPSIERGANLSSFQLATLSFEYFETGAWEGNDHIEIWVSNDSGASWGAGPVHTFTNDVGATPQTFTLDITPYITANTLTHTRVALVEKANASDEIFYVDNFQIEACTNLPATGPVAAYRLDEQSWNGSAGEVVDSSGSGLHGRAFGGALPVPARVCNGASLSGSPSGVGQYLEVADNNILDITNELTVSAWVFPDQRPATGLKTIVSKDTNFEIHINSSGQVNWWWGGGSRELTTGVAIPNGQWSHVAIVYSDFANTAQIYINGQQRASRFASGNLITNTNPLQIGADQGIASRRFDGLIDEVRVYKYAHTGASITTLMNETRPCVTASPDHFHLNHAGAGITCEPTTVTLTAHKADHSEFSVTADLNVTISTVPAVGNINPTVATITTGNAFTTFQVSNPAVTSAPHININVSDGTASETSGSAASNPGIPHDPPLQFLDTLFAFAYGLGGRFGPVTDIIPTQIAGKPSSTAPNGNTITLRAIRAADTTLTPTCRPALAPGLHTIRFGYQCRDSNGCSVDELKLSNQFFYNAASATTIAHNNGSGVSNTTQMPLVFDALGRATLSFSYANAGRIALFADTHVVAPGSQINRGATPPFVVRPFALRLEFGDGVNADGGPYHMRQDDWSDGVLNGIPANISYSNALVNPQSSSLFRTAGVNFPVALTAVQWQAADDGNSDGIADAGANLFNNPVASLFGQESTAPVLQVAHTLASPVGGTVGALAKAWNSPYDGRGTLSWSEVGIIDIQVSLANYLGDTTYTSAYDVRNVGRFAPAGFQLSALNQGSFANTCIGVSNGFTYSGQEFGYGLAPSFQVQAINGLSGITQNYSGGWSKLTPASFNISPATSSNVGLDGSDLDSDPDPLAFASNAAAVTLAPTVAGTATVTFGADTFCYGSYVAGQCQKQEENIALIPGFSPNISRTLNSVNDGEVSTLFTPAQAFAPLPGSALIRYGRLALDNVFGSELTNLVMPMYTEYFDGNTFILNTDDICTQILNTDLGVSNPLSLSSAVSVINSPPSVLTGAGRLNVELTSPGSGNTGSITVTPAAPSWLQFDWNSAAAGLENPSAQATFGIFKGNSRQIYYRQLFR